MFDRGTVMKQLRSLQILETVNLMAGGTYDDIIKIIIFNKFFIISQN